MTADEEREMRLLKLNIDLVRMVQDRCTGLREAIQVVASLCLSVCTPSGTGQIDHTRIGSLLGTLTAMVQVVGSGRVSPQTADEADAQAEAMRAKAVQS